MAKLIYLYPYLFVIVIVIWTHTYLFPDAAFEEPLAALAADGSVVTTWCRGGEESGVSGEAGAGAGGGVGAGAEE